MTSIYPQSLVQKLTDVPSPDHWTGVDKPVLYLDGKFASLNDADVLVAKKAFIVGANDKSFPSLCRKLQAQTIKFHEMRVQDISAIAHIKGLQHLAIRWNTKLSDIAPLTALPQLIALSLENTPKVYDLNPLASLTKLIALDYSGGTPTSAFNKAKTLAPIGKLHMLRDLCLTNIRVDDNSLKPLATCQALETLSVQYRFPTEDYAFLAAKLPNTKCDSFAATVPVNRKLLGGGIDTLVVGKRKPFLDSNKDAARITKYEIEFERMKNEFTQR